MNYLDFKNLLVPSGLSVSRKSRFAQFQHNRHWNVTWLSPARWFIPLSKWVITLVINGISGVSPLITGVITHLLSGMNHQVVVEDNQLLQFSVDSVQQLHCWLEDVGRARRATVPRSMFGPKLVLTKWGPRSIAFSW